MIYTIAECAVNKFLMIGRELSETSRVSCQNKFEKLVHLVGFIIKKPVRLEAIDQSKSVSVIYVC